MTDRVLSQQEIDSVFKKLRESGDDPAELRRQVTSPGGTTEAALKVLMGERGFPSLMRDAVDAAVKRAKELR